MDMVYVMLNEKGQTEPVQFVNAAGVPQPLDASDPFVARLSTGPGSGRPVRLPRECNEFVEAMEFTEYHYFVDENNKVIPIPPGSIVQGEFEDEEEVDDSQDHDMHEDDQLRNDLALVSSETAQIASEMELPAATCRVNLVAEVFPYSGAEQELTGESEQVETKLAECHTDASYADCGIQEHSGAAAMDETSELLMENTSETIFTQDEIELEEEVVSLQISEPELVAVKPLIKYSKRAAIFTSHHDLSSSIGRSADASFVGDLQVKSQSKKLKKKPVPVGAAAESQASASDKIPLQSGKKTVHHPAEPLATPSAMEPSVTDTGRPKRSVLRRSALEMLHGEGKARKLHASSGSDSEVDGGSAAQHPGKRRQSKGAEKKTLTAEKMTKTPLLSSTECKNEAQSILSPQDLPTVNADQKCEDMLEINSISNLAVTNFQSPVKRGKGRPRKLVPESPRVVDTSEVATAVQKELVSVGSTSTTDSRDESEHLVMSTVEKESSNLEAVVTSEIDVVPKGFEFSDSKVFLTALNSNDLTEPAIINVLEPGGTEMKAEHLEVITSDSLDKVKTSDGQQQKPVKRGRGRQKSVGVKKVIGFENQKNAEAMDRLCVEKEATIDTEIREMETEVSVETISEQLLCSPELDVEISNSDGELRSGQAAENEGQVIRIVPEGLSEKEEHLSTVECGNSICELEEESSGDLLKEDCESLKDICDDSTTSGHAVCKEAEDRQLDNESKTVELMIQDPEEPLVVDEVITIKNEVAAECLDDSDVHCTSGELESGITCQLAKADETKVEAETYDGHWEGSSYVVESQPVDLIDPAVEMSEELPGNETLEFDNEQASVDIDMNHGAMQEDAEDVLCSDEKSHSPVEEGANLDYQVHDEEDIQDFGHESTSDQEASANLRSDIEPVGEEMYVDRMQINSQLTNSLLKDLQGAHEHGKKVDMEPAFKKFEESVLGLDTKAVLLVAADLEHFATKIRCRLAERESNGDKTELSINQSPIPPEERVRKFVVAEWMKLRALDQELDERHSQLMAMRGQINRSESDVKQREQRLERSRLLLDLEREAIEKDQRKLLKKRETIQKQRKLHAKLRDNKKRKAETETELGTGSKKPRISGPVPMKERRPLFEAMTAIKETKTLTNTLEAPDNRSSSENQLMSLQKQISSSADECESKDSVKIEIEELAEMPLEKSCVKVEVDSEEKSCVQKSDVSLTPTGLSTVVKGKKELLRRFEADELNSPGDEQRSNQSLLHKSTEGETKPSKVSSNMPTTDGQKPNKSSSKKSTGDGQKPRKSSSHKPTTDEEKPNKLSSQKSKTDEEKPRKSSYKPTTDEHKPRKSSHKSTADEQKSSKSSSHKPKLEAPSSTVSKPLVKKSGQHSDKPKKTPALDSLTPFDCVLNQSESSTSKSSSPMTGSCTGPNLKASSGKGPSQSGGERRKDLPSSSSAKKQRSDGVDVQDSTEPSSKLGRKSDAKRLSVHSNSSSSSSSKKKDKQCRRTSAV